LSFTMVVVGSLLGIALEFIAPLKEVKIVFPTVFVDDGEDALATRHGGAIIVRGGWSGAWRGCH